jgi:putative tributyrin esterase
MRFERKALEYFLLLAAVIAGGRMVWAQPVNVASSAVSSGRIVTGSLPSKLMGRGMPYRVILPPEYYATVNSRFGVIYLLHGVGGHFDNWTERTRVAEYSDQHRLVIVMVEGGDGWYTDSISVPNDRYESYIVAELVPEIDRTFRTIAERKNRYIAGLSMGGYGAIKFGLKYPALFSVVGSFSGALAAAGGETYGGAAGRSIPPVFGRNDSETRKANDIYLMVRNLTSEKIKQVPFIYQACGTEDTFFANNRDFLALLVEKKVPHEYREQPGGHSWTFWDAQAKEFLTLVSRRKSSTQ